MKNEKELKLNKEKPTFNAQRFWLRLWSLLEQSQKQIKLLLITIVALEMTQLLGPFLLKLIIDLLTDFQMQNLAKIIWLAVAMFGSSQLVALLDYINDLRIIGITADAERYLPSNAQKKMLSLSLGYHEKENTGNKISKIQRGADKVIELLNNFFWEVVPTLVQITLTTLIMFFVDWRFGVIFLLSVPAFVYLTLKSNRRVFPLRQMRHDNYEESYGKMAQAIVNINSVQSFVQEKREEREFRTIRERIKATTLQEFSVILNFIWRRNIIIDLARFLTMLFGVYLTWQGMITIGSLVFVVTITEKALLSFFRITRLYDRVMESSEAIERLYDLGQTVSPVKNPLGGIKPKELIGQIDFENVSFGYVNSGSLALDRVSFKINSGCATALVGPSGGGKTTVAKLIYRHHDPQSGRILLDDRDLRDYDLPSFRNFIAIVPQEVEIFNLSIGDNIAYALPGASQREIEAAAKIANAEEFILKQSNGYDTLVGERGIKLSGGQRQRIGIARAILADPQILIFDEATSNLDSYSEKLIQDAMEKISKGRTFVVIAHRLSTIKKADKIIVLENGRVAETGSHFELSRTDGGIYAKLIGLQAMGDVE